jgi:hypothetical protein
MVGAEDASVILGSGFMQRLGQGTDRGRHDERVPRHLPTPCIAIRLGDPIRKLVGQQG